MNSLDDSTQKFMVYSAQGACLGWGESNLPGEIEFYFPDGEEEAYAGAIIDGEIELSSGVKMGRVEGTDVFDDEGTLVAVVRDEHADSPEGELLATIPGNLSNESRGAAAMLLVLIPRN